MLMFSRMVKKLFFLFHLLITFYSCKQNIGETKDLNPWLISVQQRSLDSFVNTLNNEIISDSRRGKMKKMSLAPFNYKIIETKY